MTYLCFNLASTLAYAVGMALLIRELRISSPEAQRENQTIPLIIVSTITYAVVVAKTYQLMQMCGAV